MRFDWDDAKNVANQKKHGVSFEEDRFFAIGPIERGLVLVVWTERDEDVVRILSARWATRGERRAYLDHKERWK